MLDVYALKHNGETSKHFHRLYVVLETDDVIVLYSGKGARVDEVRKGTHWTANYAAYKVFLKHDHFNFVIVEKEMGNEYYCNLASIPIIETDKITYIDYDIDIILSPEGTISVHDIKEFEDRRISYRYSDELVQVLLSAKSDLEKALFMRTGYFASDFYQMIQSMNVRVSS